MITRLATREELPEVSRMHCLAWGGDYEAGGKRLQTRYDEIPATRDSVFVAEDENGKLAATISIHPYQMTIDGNVVDMGGIGGVTALPEYRVSGGASSLLKYGLRCMREKGVSISVLNPFHHNFYRRYGWELTYDFMEYTFPMDVLKKYRSKGVSYRELCADDEAEMNRLHREYCLSLNGMILRDQHRWKELFENKGMLKYGVFDENGVMRGYVMLVELVGGYNGAVDVKEIVAESWHWKRQLLGFVYGFNSTHRTVKFTVPSNDEIILDLDDNRQEIKLNMHMESRIVDVEKFFPQKRFDPELDVAFTMQITDEHAPWNDGTFCFIIKDGLCTVEKTEGLPQVRITIQRLTQMAVGAVSPKRLAAIDGIQIVGTDEEKKKLSAMLEKVFPEKQSFLLEAF